LFLFCLESVKMDGVISNKKKGVRKEPISDAYFLSDLIGHKMVLLSKSKVRFCWSGVRKYSVGRSEKEW
jgi:hypothetical protein